MDFRKILLSKNVDSAQLNEARSELCETLRTQRFKKQNLENELSTREALADDQKSAALEETLAKLKSEIRRNEFRLNLIEADYENIANNEKITHAENLKRRAIEAAEFQAKELDKKYLKLCEGLIALGVANEICEELAKKAARACQETGISFENYQPPEQIISTGAYWSKILNKITLPDIHTSTNLWPQPVSEATRQLVVGLRNKTFQDFKKRGFISDTENP